MAIDAIDSLVIDEAHAVASSEPIDLELVSAPLSACERIVVRTGANGQVGGRVVVESIDCEDLGPAQAGEELAPPEPLTLRPVSDWPRYYGRSLLTVMERRRAARYAQLARVKRMPWIEQLRVHVYPNDDLSRALYTSGLYEPLTMLVLRRLLIPGAVFIDVGANAGLFTMVASRWVGPSGHVYSFEPSPREYSRLVDHLELNKLDNVTPVRQALGGHEGSASLRIAQFPHAGVNTLGASFAYPAIRADRLETVTVTTLDRFARDRRLPRVDVIKMDIEGSELAALQGAHDVLARVRPALIVEISAGALSACGTSPEQVVSLLTAAGYRVHRIGAGAELIPVPAGALPGDDNIVALPVERPLV